MGPAWETICAGIVVGAAVLWAVRAIRRAAGRKTVCSSCGASGACPLADRATGTAPGPTVDPEACPSAGKDAPMSSASP